MLIRALAEGWADKDIEKAFKFLESPSTSDIPDELMFEIYGAVMTKHAEYNPESAAQIVDALESENVQMRIIEPIINHYAKKDFGEAMNWVLNIDNEGTRDAGMDQLIQNFSDNNSDEILEQVIENQSELSSNVISAAFGATAKHDPLKAIEKISSIDPEAQPASTSLLTSIWLKNDKAGAMDYYNSQAKGQVFETGVETIVNTISSKEPIEAIKWASRLSDTTKRFELISNVVDVADVKQLNSFQEYLNTVDITPDKREILDGKISTRIASSNAPLVLPK